MATYRKTATIGSSDWSTVYRGEHVELERVVAVKELHAHYAQQPVRRQRYLREARRIAKLAAAGGGTAPRIVQVFDTVESRNCQVIMELLRESAKSRLEKAPLPPAEVYQIVEQCLGALQVFHSQRWLHGNLKPSNLLFDESGQVKLSDGRCLEYEKDEVPPTGDREAARYLAPEWSDLGFGALGPAADLYSLGIIAIELLSGPGFATHFRAAQTEMIDAGVRWLQWHCARDELAPAAATVAENVPPSLAECIDRMTKKVVSERFSSADAAIAVLRQSRPTQVTAPAAGQAAANHAGTKVAPPRPPDAPSPVQARVTLPDSLAYRPTDPVLIRIVSGSMSGDFVGTNADRFVVGDSPDGTICFDAERDPGVLGRSLVFRREPQGWEVMTATEKPFLVNSSLVTQQSSLRSGDVVRMSAMGPDLQFVIQTTPVGFAGDARKAPGARPLAPRPPAPPKPPAHDAKGEDKAIVGPSSGRGPQTNVASAVDRHPAGGKSAVILEAIDFRSWSKKTRDRALIAAALVVAVIAFLLFPGGENTTPAQDEPVAGDQAQP